MAISDPPERVNNTQTHGSDTRQQSAGRSDQQGDTELTDKSKGGKSPFSPAPTTGIASTAKPRPSSPPIRAITSDSARTKKSTKRSVNPIAFSTASSPVRSRTEIAMVLPVTSSKVKKTTLPMVRIRNSMFPSCLAKPAWNADSVSVLVSVEEFANPVSIALATRTALSGLSSFRTYQPIEPFIIEGRFSSKYFHCSQNWLSSPPGWSFV